MWAKFNRSCEQPHTNKGENLNSCTLVSCMNVDFDNASINQLHFTAAYFFWWSLTRFLRTVIYETENHTYESVWVNHCRTTLLPSHVNQTASLGAGPGWLFCQLCAGCDCMCVIDSCTVLYISNSSSPNSMTPLTSCQTLWMWSLPHISGTCICIAARTSRLQVGASTSRVRSRFLCIKAHEEHEEHDEPVHEWEAAACGFMSRCM